MYKTSTNYSRALLLLLTGILCALQISAQSRQISVAQALSRASRQFNVKFAYEHKIVSGKQTDEKYLQSTVLDEVLKNILYPHNLVFLYVSEKQYTIVSREGYKERADLAGRKETEVQQDVYISGTVTDQDGQPMPGANIKSNADNSVVRTNERGEFSLRTSGSATSISVSFIGYEISAVDISSGNFSGLKVRLRQSSANVLDEVKVVSTGYQTISKERATGSAVTIGAKQLETVPSPNIINRIESMIPGVKVNITNSGSSFTYRNNQIAINSGTRTQGTSDYNVNIRGNSTVSGERFPLVVVDGAIAELDLSTINPNDIENISFLKDAAAASIWGVRAANGVVVVTTKRGKVGQAPQVSFSANGSVSDSPDLNYLRLMSSAQTIQYEQELVNKRVISQPLATTVGATTIGDVSDLTFKLNNGQITQQAYDAVISEYSGRDIRDQIQKYTMQKSTSQQYNFAVRGGGNQTSYFYSASYSKEDPYDKGVNGKRLTVALNNTFKLFGAATLSTNVRGAFMRFNNNGIGLSQFLRPSAGTFLPYNQIVDDNGNRVRRNVKYYSGWTSSLYSKGFLDWGYNALDELDNMDNTQKDNNYTVNLELRVPIVKNLSASGFFSNEAGFSSTRAFYNESSYYYRDLVNTYTAIPVTGQAANSIGLSPGIGGVLNQVNTTSNNYTVRGQLSYDGEFARNHQLSAVAGSEIRQTKVGQGNNTMYGYNLQTGISRAVNYLAPYASVLGYNMTLNGAPTQQDKTRRFLSYYANAAYTYLSRYTLSGSVRYDDYNNFGVDRKYRATPLYSFGAKWDIKKEAFMNNVSFVNSLGLRATYGVNGNISTTLYPFTYLSLSSYNPETGLPGASIVAQANPELRWEKTYVTNLGVDFSVFGNKLSGSVEYYKKHGTDLFYNFPINGTYGTTTLTRNATTLDGKGVDIGLNGRFYSTSDWEVAARLNYAYNTNVVTDNRFKPTSSFYNAPAYGGLLEGYASDKMLVFRNAGLDKNGMTQVYNEKGDIIPVTGNISTVDALKYAGRTSPSHFGSLTPSIRFKDLTLLAIATYQFGSVFLKPSVSAYPSARTGATYDLHADVAKRWQNPGDEATTVVPGVAGVYAPLSLQRYMQSDINVLKGDYIRLRELSLTYRIPVARINKYVKSANVGLNVRNLGLLWTANKEGLDPDFANPLNSNLIGIPESVSYNLSVNVNF